MKYRAYRFVCMLLAAMVLLSPAGAKAEFFDWFAAETPAPARSDDGVVRVLLSSLGTPETVNLTLEGPETLARRCQLLRDHKTEVESRIAEMQTLLQKVSWKIGYFEGQYEEYQKQKEKSE